MSDVEMLVPRRPARGSVYARAPLRRASDPRPLTAEAMDLVVHKVADAGGAAAVRMLEDAIARWRRPKTRAQVLKAKLAAAEAAAREAKRVRMESPPEDGEAAGD